MKRLLIFISIIALSLFLYSCTDGDTSSSGKMVEWYELSKDADYDGSKVTIRFWHRMGEQNQAVLQGWIEEFNKIYPNIEVIEENVAGDYDALADKISYGITAGDFPDISESYPDHIARYAQGDAPLALNNFINNPNIGYTEEEIADFLTGLWNEGSSYDNEGTILSLPFTKSSEALFYNKTYFDKHGYEAPKTWDELFAIAEDIKAREPDSYPFGYDSEGNLFITASEQWKAPYTGYDANGKGEVLFNNAESKAMAKYFKDKVDRGLMLTRALNGEAYTSDIMKLGERPGEKNLYMYIGSTGGARYAYGTEAVFDTGYRVGVAPVPVKDMNHRRQIQQGPNINLFKKDNEQQMIAAWLFVKFMLRPENTAEFALQSGYAPVRHSAYETETWNNYVAKIKDEPTTMAEAQNKTIKEAIDMFRDNDDIFFTSAVFNLSSKTRNEVGSLLIKILSYSGDNVDKYIDDEYQDSFDFIVN